MKKSVILILVVVALALAGVGGAIAKEPTKWDMTALDSWCKGEDSGAIRMVGAWAHSRYDDCLLLEDETGNLWEVDGVLNVADDDFLLLWLVDNNTAEVKDDVIIKVWREVH